MSTPKETGDKIKFKYNTNCELKNSDISKCKVNLLNSGGFTTAQAHTPQEVLGRDVIAYLSPRASFGFSCHALFDRTVAPRSFLTDRALRQYTPPPPAALYSPPALLCSRPRRTLVWQQPKQVCAASPRSFTVQLAIYHQSWRPKWKFNSRLPSLVDRGEDFSQIFFFYSKRRKKKSASR